VFAAIAAMFAALAGCSSDSSSDSAPIEPVDNDPTPTVSTYVVVTDTAGEPVVGAKVYAIPAADVAALGAVELDRSAENFGEYSTTALSVDEPLEDLINGNYTPAGGGVATYLVTAATDEDGKAEIPEGLDEEQKFFIYVQPAADDTAHLPGGSLCREAVTPASLDDELIEITVSGTPSATATFIGSSTCLVCHPDQEGMTKTAHKLGFMAPNDPSYLQDTSEFEGDDEYNMFAALEKYTAAGTTIYFYDYDGTRSFDKFKTLEHDPRLDEGFTGTVYATVRIYSDAGKYYAEFTNVINPLDPPMTHEVVLTYGGGVYKQRPITMVDDSLFMIPLQFNARGDETSPDRVRKNWRDYHMDWWVASIETGVTMTFKPKPLAKVSVDVQCAPCHFNGYTATNTGVVDSGGVDYYYQATGVADASGETHPVLGKNQELNIGCETCHGPGSEHRAAFGAGEYGKFIVTPQNLTPERESMICGQCHSRPQGNGTFKNDSPLDSTNKMMRAGTSRADFLANNTSRDDSASSNMWADGLHSKAHHQQYTDFIQSSKYRNGSKLLTCASCHDLHAPVDGVRHQLKASVADGSLCQSCHTDVVLKDHQEDKTGVNMYGATCVQCHNTKTANSGAGSNQLAEEAYVDKNGKALLHGDITSHVFDVPTKAEAPMPVPYTAPLLDNSMRCGFCHVGL
jgi:hypothetical protein